MAARGKSAKHGLLRQSRSDAVLAVEPPPLLPPAFRSWFESRGWQPREHQIALLEKTAARRSTLLIAPTGSGKTLAGFLPSLVALAGRKREKGERSVHTLYVSPLKALAVDVARNLLTPLEQMQLPIRVETRTGDTSTSRKQRQRARPPTSCSPPPSRSRCCCRMPTRRASWPDLDTVILDELHALSPTKRGDLLALDLARLQSIAPGQVRIGLSATVARPSELRAYLMPQPGTGVMQLADLVQVEGGARPEIHMMETEARAALVGPHLPLRAARDLRGHQGAQPVAGVRQHAQPGRAAVPGAVAHQR